MSEVIVTAAAWVTGEPRMITTKEGEPAAFFWRMLAEASVTDPAGAPIGKLPKNAWRVHVTDATGVTYAVGFSVAEVVPIINQPVRPGFYLLTLDEFPTSPWVAPAACGLAIASKRPSSQGQVVVPVALAGPTAVNLLATPSF